MAIASLTVDKNQYADLEAVLGGIHRGAQKATTVAINKTLVSGRSIVVKRLAEQINLKQKSIRDVTSIRKATWEKLEGTIVVKKDAVDAIEFKPKETKTGVKVKVNKKKGFENWKSAFIATMKNGKRGVFERQRLGVAKSLPQGLALHSKETGQQFGVVPSGRIRAYARVTKVGRARRLPIQKRWGPTAAGVLEKAPGVINEVMQKIGGTFYKNLSSQVDRLLKRKKSDPI